MPRGKSIGVATRSRIITLHEEGYASRQIGERLNVAPSTIKYTIRRYRETGDLEDRDRPGPSRITTQADDRHLQLISKRNRRKTAPEIASEFNRGRQQPISVTTVKRRLAEGKLHGRVAARKPLLRRGNRLKRLQWAREHKDWTVEQWQKVLWTDESIFRLFGSSRRVFVRRSTNERMLPQCIVPTIKHGGGSITVWGCFSYSGTGTLHRINGIMRKEHYREILEAHAIPSGLRLIGENFTFMHDNDPKHTARICSQYLRDQSEANVLRIMTWPPQSPDLNPIELLWDELDRRVRSFGPSSKEQLWNVLQREWDNIPGDTLRKLIARMPRVARAVINAKGGFFDEKNI